MPRRRRFFTLPEVVAVILIIGLTAALAVPMLRKTPPSRQLEQAILEFEKFCARVRYQAAENGADRSVCFEPGTRTFFMLDPDDPDEENTARSTKEPMFKWVLPEDFEMDEDDFADTAEDHVEVFRFFPDGGASGIRSLTLRCGTFSRLVTVSPLTGLPSVRDTSGETP